MAWNGSGVFSRTNGVFNGSTLWQQSKVALRKIFAEDHDIHDEDLAQGINNTLTKDGQNAPTADLPMNGRKHTNVADAEERNQYASYGQLLDTSQYIDAARVGGTANAITFTPDPAYAAYVEGLTFRFVAKAANTGTVTIQLNALAAKDVVKDNNVPLAAGDLAADTLYVVVYDGTRFKLFGSASQEIQSATTSVEGIVEYATDGELAGANPPPNRVVNAEQLAATNAALAGKADTAAVNAALAGKADDNNTLVRTTRAGGLNVVELANEAAWTALGNNRNANTLYIWAG